MKLSLYQPFYFRAGLGLRVKTHREVGRGLTKPEDEGWC